MGYLTFLAAVDFIEVKWSSKLQLRQKYDEKTKKKQYISN